MCSSHTTPTLSAGTLAVCVSSASPRSGAKVCPTANFLVRYTKKETNGEMTEGGEEARELSGLGGQLRAG